jgi:hypothetical protein
VFRRKGRRTPSRAILERLFSARGLSGLGKSEYWLVEKPSICAITRGGYYGEKERIFEYTQAEVVGQSITILIPPELRDEGNKILPWKHALTVRDLRILIVDDFAAFRGFVSVWQYLCGDHH